MRIVIHDFAGHPFQFDLSRELARRGHQVWHLYFGGDKGPKGGKSAGDPENLVIQPVEITRDYKKGDFVGRFFNDSAYGMAVAKRLSEIKPDVVISGNTPPDAQRLILSATRKTGAAFVNWIQDLYGLAIKRILTQKNAMVGFAAGTRYVSLEEGLLAESDAIVAISPGFRDHISRRVGPKIPFFVIQNWGSIETLPCRPKDNGWSREQGLEDKFVILYSGTLGLKHDPGLLLALADAFKGDPEVVVAVAAAGLGRNQLEAELKVAPRPNLRLMPLQPIETFPDMLGGADLVVAVLEPDAAAYSVPSKVLSYLCAGRPILMSAPADNLAVKVITDAKAGRVVDADRRDIFIATARALRDDAALRVSMGDAGRVYAEANFRPAEVADRFEEVIKVALASKKTAGGQRIAAA